MGHIAASRADNGLPVDEQGLGEALHSVNLTGECYADEESDKPLSHESLLALASASPARASRR